MASLTDFSDLQDSDEELWGTPKMSFEFTTRIESDEELVERTYTFSYAKEWDEWTFYEYEEKRSNTIDESKPKNWRRTRHTYWDDSDAPDVQVPQSVTDKLADLLDKESIELTVYNQ